MGKTGNFNVNVDKENVEEFNHWSEKVPGKKFQHITGALKAIQALYEIDNGLAIALMNPDLSMKDAVKRIKQGIVDAYLRGWIDMLPENQVHKILEDARKAEKKI